MRRFSRDQAPLQEAMGGIVTSPRSEPETNQ